MGRIAEYNRQPLQTQVNTQNIASAGQFGAAVSNLGEQVSNIAFRAQQVQDQNYVNEKSQELEENTKQLFMQHQQENASNPKDSFSKFQERYQALKDKYYEEAPSLGSRQRLNQVTNALENSMKTSIKQWEIEQNVLNTGDTTDKGLKNQATEALRAANPDLIPTMIQKGQPFIDTLAQVAAPHIVSKTRQDFEKNVALNTFEGMISKGNLASAQKYLDSRKFDDQLGADGIKYLTNKIQNEQESAAAKQANIESLKWSNPYQYAKKIGDTEGLAPLNAADPASFLQRKMFVEYFNEKHGTTMPLMAPTEVSEFSAKLKKGDPIVETQNLATLSVSMAPEQFNDFANLVFKNEPSMGAALALAQESPKISEEIIHGGQLIAKKAVVMEGESEKSVRLSYDDTVADAIPDPTLRNRAYQAVRAVVAARSMARGNPSTIATEDIDSAIADVMGPVIEINDRKTMSFKGPTGEFLNEDQFEDLFEDLTSETLQKTHGDVFRDSSGRAISMDDIHSNYYLQTIGDGIYYVKNTESNSFAANKEGKAFVLNLKGLVFDQVKGNDKLTPQSLKKLNSSLVGSGAKP